MMSTTASRRALPLRSVRGLPALAVLLVLAACGDSSKGPPDPGALALVAAPEQGAAGSNASVVVKVTDRNGAAMRNKQVSWSVTEGEGSVSAPQSVTDASGQATITWTLGTRAGTNRMTASLGGDVAPLVITTTGRAGAPAAITLPLDSARITSFASPVQLQAQLQDAHANPVTGHAIAWSAQPTGIVTVSPAGLVRGVANGEATVTASSGQVSRSIPVRVSQVPASIVIEPEIVSAFKGDSVRATATVRDSGAATIANAAVVWTSGNQAIVSVSANGWVHGLEAGGTTLRASSAVNANVFAEVPVGVTDAGALNVKIDGLYITQSTQTMDGNVPLIAGRDAFLRVFVTANRGNSATPPVRVRFYRNGQMVDERTIQPSQGNTAVPEAVNRGTLVSSWNVPLPGSLIQTGLSVVAEVDPDNSLNEGNRADNLFPTNGTPLALDVRATAPFRARLVPVLQPNGLLADATEANKHTYMQHAMDMYPIPGYDVDVRAPYSFSANIPAQYDSIWSRLLNETRLLRLAENHDNRYYYGVLKPSYNSGGTGLGYIGLPAAIGVDWTNWRSYTAAHEWGHNFGRSHVDCGGPANPDQNYPYPNGEIGTYGFRLATGTLLAPNTATDLMSYCVTNIWISDYTYRAVMTFRGSSAGPATSSGAAQRSLLVWGRITDNGLVLEPSFEVVTRPTLPTRAGPHRLEAFDASGARLFDLAFEADVVDHIEGERHFAFAVPLGNLPANAIAGLRLMAGGRQVEMRRGPAQGPAAARDVRVTRGQGGRVRLDWDAAGTSAVMVRDATTGDVLSIGRGGKAEFATNRADLDIITSDGVGSTTRRVRVTP